jgi:hypothetical protein
LVARPAGRTPISRTVERRREGRRCRIELNEALYAAEPPVGGSECQSTPARRRAEDGIKVPEFDSRFEELEPIQQIVGLRADQRTESRGEGSCEGGGFGSGTPPRPNVSELLHHLVRRDDPDRPFLRKFQESPAWIALEMVGTHRIHEDGGLQQNQASRRLRNSSSSWRRASGLCTSCSSRPQRSSSMSTCSRHLRGACKTDLQRGARATSRGSPHEHPSKPAQATELAAVSNVAGCLRAGQAQLGSPDPSRPHEFWQLDEHHCLRRNLPIRRSGTARRGRLAHAARSLVNTQSFAPCPTGWFSQVGEVLGELSKSASTTYM